MKRSEYETQASAFRALLVAESQKPQGEQVWPEPADWLSVPAIAFCSTPSCPVRGQHFPVTVYENADGIHRGQCGRCHQPTTIILALEED